MLSPLQFLFYALLPFIIIGLIVLPVVVAHITKNNSMVKIMFVIEFIFAPIILYLIHSYLKKHKKYEVGEQMLP